MTTYFNMTTYQEVWDMFNSLGRVNDTDLPTTSEGVYRLIDNARILFNGYLKGCVVGFIELGQDDLTETFTQNLDDSYKELLVECIKLVIVRNMFSQFISDSEVFQTSIGVRNYRSQYASRGTLVKMQENRIDKLVMRLADLLED